MPAGSASHAGLSRRALLRQAAVVPVGFAGLRTLLGGDAPALAAFGSDPERAAGHGFGFGPLVPDPHRAFDLPAGFSYRVISKVGERMDDGFFVPALHDGMGTFPGPDGLTLIVRNHEVPYRAPRFGPFGWNLERLDGVDPTRIYDRGHPGQPPCLGGTTTLVYDTREQRLVQHSLSLVGTSTNCAGGPTPWGSWITCEETEQRANEYHTRHHGYNFEVPARMTMGLVEPVPLKAMGRFKHEAIAVDPRTGIVYETEDLGDGLLYRFIPDARGNLHAGRLQALAIVDAPSFDLRNWPADAEPVHGARPADAPPVDMTAPRAIAPGTTLDVRWIDMDDIDSPNNDLRYRGFAAGAARLARAEGIWFGDDCVFIACTDGGRRQIGQIWKYRPSRYEGTTREAEAPATLELFLESEDDAVLRNADNLTIGPNGDLFVCEDGIGTDRLIGVTPQGVPYTIGMNRMSDAELAGCCFSPDGSTLFLNVQQEGITLAITGPWRG